MANNVVNFKRGTAAQYNAATKDADTLYFVTSSGGSPSVEMGELFLGSVRIGVGIGTSADPSTNKTYYGLKNYIDGSFVSAVAEGTGNGQIAVTKNGTTTQVSVHGLGSAAYTASTDYATSAQGAKADTAIQGLSVGTDGDLSSALSITVNANKQASFNLYSASSAGSVGLAVNANDELYGDIRASYVHGTLGTADDNKLLTRGSADSRYGRLGSANTWTGNNTFSGSFSATDGVSLSADSGDVAFSISPSGIELNSRYGVHIYSPDANYSIVSDAPIKYATGVAPTDNQDLVTKNYVDSMVSSNLRYVGDSSTVPTVSGATVQGLPSGFTWKIGDVVTCSATGYTGREYLLFQGGTNIAANWRELGDESTYALKTTTITGTGYLEGGGDLSANRTIDLKSTYKTKISDAIQSISGDNAISATTNTNRATTISLTLDSTNGQLDFTKGTNGLYASLKSSYVEGTLSTGNKLLTASYGDGRYGRLASSNAWTNTNSFQGTVYFDDPDTGDTILQYSPSTSSLPPQLTLGYVSATVGIEGSTVSISGTITSDLITCSSTPTAGGHLTNKTYVDSAVTTALTWASI